MRCVKATCRGGESSESKNALPGICGRVCPQESQCEARCTLEKRKAPIAIGRLERFVADWERKNKTALPPPSPPPPSTGKKVAVVGSGPAGLTTAAELAKLAMRSPCSKRCMWPGAC